MSLCIRLMVCCPQALEASGVIQSESGSLRGREVDGVKSQSKGSRFEGLMLSAPSLETQGLPSEGRRRGTPQLKQEVNSLLFLFVLLRTSMDWRAISFTLFTEPNQSLLGTPLQSHPEIMFDQLLGRPLTQSTCHIKLTIIDAETWQDMS